MANIAIGLLAQRVDKRRHQPAANALSAIRRPHRERRQPGFIAAAGDDRHRRGDISIQPDAGIQQAQPFSAKTLDKNLYR